MLSEILSTTLLRNEMIELGLIGWVAGVLGVYSFIKAMNEGDRRRTAISIIATLYGLLMVSICPIIRSYTNDYANNNKSNLISVNAVNTENKSVVMKFKEPDNSIKEIRASVKERFTTDKRKCNKYSLKNIENGYVIYYISEDVHAPKKLAPKYVKKMNSLENVVKE